MLNARLGILLTIALALCAAGPAAATPGQGSVKLPDEAGLVILGAAPYDQLGASLTAPGDVDGDGRGDLFAGSQSSSGGSGGLGYGAAFMLRGGPAGVLALSSTDLPPAFGHSIRGSSTSDVMADGAARVGDVNADGRPDLAVRTVNGQIFVVYGRAGQRPTVRVDQPLPPSDGFEMKSSSAIGPISSAGDFNGDGVGDLVVASPGDETICTDIFDCDPYTGTKTSPASVKVVFGRAARSGPPLDLATLSSSDGVTVTLPPSPVSDVEAAGDVNGDGHGDIIVGMPEMSGGRAYVIYGAATPPSFQISGDDIPQSRGFVLLADRDGTRLGTAVAGVGDVNGDQLPDIAVSAPAYEGGRVWIVHSRTLAGKTTLTSLAAPGRELFAGPGASAGFGSDLAGVGDVNGDGRPDLAMSGPAYSFGTGAAWVLYSPGASGVTGTTLAGSVQPARGFIIRPSELSAGHGMRLAGLENGQLAVAFPQGGGAQSGAVYIVSLKTSARTRRTLPSLSVKPARTSVISGSVFKLALKTTSAASVTMRLFRVGSRKSCARRRAGESVAACTPELIAVGGSARALGARTQGTRSASFPARAAGKKLATGKYLAVFRASDGKSRSLLRTAPFTVK